jgi:hypothetical protein
MVDNIVEEMNATSMRWNPAPYKREMPAHRGEWQRLRSFHEGVQVAAREADAYNGEGLAGRRAIHRGSRRVLWLALGKRQHCAGGRGLRPRRGMAMQIDPMKRILTPHRVTHRGQGGSLVPHHTC